MQVTGPGQRPTYAIVIVKVNCSLSWFDIQYCWRDGRIFYFSHYLQLVEFSFLLKENKLISIFLSITFVPARFGLIWIWGKKLNLRGKVLKSRLSKKIYHSEVIGTTMITIWHESYKIYCCHNFYYNYLLCKLKWDKWTYLWKGLSYMVYC